MGVMSGSDMVDARNEVSLLECRPKSGSTVYLKELAVAVLICSESRRTALLLKKRRMLGCVNSRAAVGGSQEAGFTQPNIRLSLHNILK